MKALFRLIVCTAFLSTAGLAYGQSSDDSCAANKDKMQILVNYKRKVKPESVAVCKSAFLTCQEQSIMEPGCKKYELYQSITDSTIFMMVELWENDNAFDTHMQTSYLKQYLEETRGINASTSSIEFQRVYICPNVNN